MSNALLERRVDDLRDLVFNLAQSVPEMQAQQRLTGEQLRRAAEQQQTFSANVYRLTDDVRNLVDEMGGFKDEVLDFKNRMQTFTEETRQATREMRRQWGESANKMGRMAEDLVAPSVPRILRTVVGDGDLEDMAVRVRRRRHPETGRMREFDVVARGGQYVLINETKSSLEFKDIRKFVRVMSGARDCFPEYADKKFIGAVASRYVTPNLVQYGERPEFIGLGFGEDVMDVLNSPGFKPRMF